MDGITDHPDSIVMDSDTAESVIYAILYGPELEEFNLEYQIITDRALNDPDERFHEGVAMVTVIKRLSDNKLFGYPWWQQASNHGEPYNESNTDEGDYAWYPVEEFTVTGYTIKEPK